MSPLGNLLLKSDLFITAGFVLISAFLLAQLEIQIEGKEGWAKSLPTWRRKFGLPYLWEKELTGYHFYLLLFVFVLLHTPFIFGTPWSLAMEMAIFQTYIILFTLEDFLWFVLNPHFGLKKFNRKNIWWHKHWLLGVPVDYLSAVVVVIALYLARTLIS